MTDPGRHLTPKEKEVLSRYNLPKIDLDNAILHVGCPLWLRPDANRVTLGNHIWLRQEFWDRYTGLNSKDSDAWYYSRLAHELVHVGQYRAGMTKVSYAAECVQKGVWTYDNKYEAPALTLETQVEQSEKFNAHIKQYFAKALTTKPAIAHSIFPPVSPHHEAGWWDSVKQMVLDVWQGFKNVNEGVNPNMVAFDLSTPFPTEPLIENTHLTKPVTPNGVSKKQGFSRG